RDCGFCIVFGTLHRAATNCFRPWRKRPVNLSPISHAMDLDCPPLQENRRANPANPPCLGCVTGDVRLMHSDAKELGHMRVADRKTAWGIPGIECDHTFLRWQRYSQSKICLRLACQERHRAGPCREQMSSLACGLSKKRGASTSGLRSE